MLIERERKYHHYHQVKLTNMKIYLAKKYYILIKVESCNKINILILRLEKAFEKETKIIKDQ